MIFRRGDRIEPCSDLAEELKAFGIDAGPHVVAWSGRMFDDAPVVILESRGEVWRADAFQSAETPAAGDPTSFEDFSKSILRKVVADMGLTYEDLKVEWPRQAHVVGVAGETIQAGEAVSVDASTGRLRRALPSDRRSFYRF